MSFILTTIFDFGLAAALFWCFFHEDKLISIEKKLICAIRRRRLHIVKSCPYNAVSDIRR